MVRDRHLGFGMWVQFDDKTILDKIRSRSQSQETVTVTKNSNFKMDGIRDLKVDSH